MRCKKFFIIIIVVFFCFLLVKAQNSDDDYVHKDSIVNIGKLIEKKISHADITEKISKNDTALQINGYAALNDSAEALKNIPDFAYAKNLDSLLKILQNEESKVAKSEQSKPSWLELFFSSSITKIFFWTLACLFIGFILHRLFFTEGFFKKSTLQTTITVLPDETEHLSATTDYTKHIEQAVLNKNYRLAVRYHYLQTLQKLAAKEIIQFTADKTNYQYVKELYDKIYKNEFARLTQAYEYVWYGGFVTDEMIFEAIQANFKNFNNLI